MSDGCFDELERGLVTVHATEMRRNADGAREIAAERQAAKAGSQRCGAATGGPTWRSRDVPRIVRGSVDRIVALPVTEHAWNVRLADHDGACRFETLDRHSGSSARRILERQQA